MRTMLTRLLGLAVTVAGCAFLVWLAEVSFRTTKPWSDVLVAIGMPMMLLLALAGCAIVFGGVCLMLRRDRFRPAERQPQP